MSIMRVLNKEELIATKQALYDCIFLTEGKIRKMQSIENITNAQLIHLGRLMKEKDLLVSAKNKIEQQLNS
jgi:hypothetical protein